MKTCLIQDLAADRVGDLDFQKAQEITAAVPVVLFVCVFFFTTIAPAYAGGFYLQEQSAMETGRAFSGGAASADNASTVFFNPAALTELEGVNIDISANVLFIDSSQSNNNSVRSVPGQPDFVAIGGNDGGNPFSQPIAIPAAFVTGQVSNSVWLGLGISSPFGVVVEYDEGFFGRYDSLRSDLFTVNIQPTLAVKVNDKFSIGGGIDAQYIDVTLSNAIPNVSPLQADGFLKVSGDDWSFGWNLGVFAKVKSAQLGAHYRSRMKHKLDGKYSVSGLLGPLDAGNVELPTKAPITLPDIATLSVTLGVNKPVRFHGTVRRYNWSVFDKIDIRPEGIDPLISQQNYRDTWSAAFSVAYDISRRTTIRGGAMYDETPTVRSLRTTRVPDGDRVWLTLGASYYVTETIALNFSYAHIFISTERSNRVDGFFEGSAAEVETILRSESRASTDIVGFSLSAKF